MTDDTAVIIIVIIMLHDSSVYVYVWLTMLHDRWYSWGLSETTLWTSSSMSELKRPRKFLVLDSGINILQLNWMIRDWKRGVLSKQINKSIFNSLNSQLLFFFFKFLAQNAYFFEFSAQNPLFFINFLIKTPFSAEYSALPGLLPLPLELLAGGHGAPHVPGHVAGHVANLGPAHHL